MSNINFHIRVHLETSTSKDLALHFKKNISLLEDLKHQIRAHSETSTSKDPALHLKSLPEDLKQQIRAPRSLRHINQQRFGVPPEILSRGPEAPKAYIEANQTEMERLFWIRLILVGQERVGKTSLRKSFAGQK